MSITCKVTFDNNPMVFYTANKMCGMVQLNLKKEEKVRSVYIRMKGKAVAEWVKMSVKFTGTEKLLDQRVYLMGGATSRGKLETVTHGNCSCMHCFQFKVKW